LAEILVEIWQLPLLVRQTLGCSVPSSAGATSEIYVAKPFDLGAHLDIRPPEPKLKQQPTLAKLSKQHLATAKHTIHPIHAISSHDAAALAASGIPLSYQAVSKDLPDYQVVGCFHFVKPHTKSLTMYPFQVDREMVSIRLCLT
jgi:hypothetical protein